MFEQKFEQKLTLCLPFCGMVVPEWRFNRPAYTSAFVVPLAAGALVR